MNIGELAKGVAATTRTSEAEAKKAVVAVFDQIATAAARVKRSPFLGLASSPSRIVQSVRGAIQRLGKR